MSDYPPVYCVNCNLTYYLVSARPSGMSWQLMTTQWEALVEPPRLISACTLRKACSDSFLDPQHLKKVQYYHIVLGAKQILCIRDSSSWKFSGNNNMNACNQWIVGDKRLLFRTTYYYYYHIIIILLLDYYYGQKWEQDLNSYSNHCVTLNISWTSSHPALWRKMCLPSQSALTFDPNISCCSDSKY